MFNQRKGKLVNDHEQDRAIRDLQLRIQGMDETLTRVAAIAHPPKETVDPGSLQGVIDAIYRRIAALEEQVKNLVERLHAHPTVDVAVRELSRGVATLMQCIEDLANRVEVVEDRIDTEES